MTKKSTPSKRTPSAAQDPSSQGALSRPRSSSAPGCRLSPEQFSRQLKAAEASARPGSDPVAALAAAGIRSPLLLAGAQHVRIKRTLEIIRGRFFPPDRAARSSYFGSELTSENSLGNIRSALTNLSLFSAAELVIIYDAERIKSAVAAALCEILERNRAGSVVIFTAENLGAKSPLISHLQRTATIIEFPELEGAGLRRWIEREAARYCAAGDTGGIGGIEPEAVDVLIRSYGADVTALAQETAKLAMLTPAGEKISRQLVENVSLRRPEAASFSLFQEIAKRNAPAAVALTHVLVEQGMHPLQLSAFLSRCIRTLIAQTAGPSGSSIAPELNNPWFLRNLGPAARTFSLEDLARAVALLAELDFQLKDSKLPDVLTLSNAVQRLALRAFAPLR